MLGPCPGTCRSSECLREGAAREGPGAEKARGLEGVPCMASCSVRPRPPGAGSQPAQRLLLRGPPNLEELCLGVGMDMVGGMSQPLPHLQSCSPLRAVSPSPGKATGSQPAHRNAICHVPTPAPVSEAWTKLEGSGSDFCLPCTPVLTPLRRGRDSPAWWLLMSRMHLLQVLVGVTVTEERDTAHPSPHLPPGGWFLCTLKGLDRHTLHLLLVSAPTADTSLNPLLLPDICATSPSLCERVVPRGPALPCSRAHSPFFLWPDPPIPALFSSSALCLPLFAFGFSKILILFTNF